MELYILDTGFDFVGVIDSYSSVLWNKKYNGTGECEIYAPCDNAMLSLLQMGNYVFRYDDDMFCRIDRVEIQTDVENGDYIVATASDICTILSNRIVRRQIVFNGKVAEFIKKAVMDNAINPDVSARKIENLIFDDSNFSGFTDVIEIKTVSDDLLQLIQSTCEAYGYGFRISYDLNQEKLVCRLYKGVDKSTADGNEYVEFSPDYSNIISSGYKSDETNQKNIVYVGYKTADEEFEMLSMYNGSAEPTGKSRREIYVDGTGTNRSVTVDELQAIFHGNALRNPVSGGESGVYYVSAGGAEIQIVATFTASTNSEGEYEEKITVTDYTYLILIRAIGRNTLAEHTITTSFSGDIDTVDTYEYKTDYNLGDIVKVKNDYGIEAQARITEIMESDDTENGYQVEPKFEY